MLLLLPFPYVVMAIISVKRFANHGFKSFEMLYKATRCDDSSLLKNFADAFQTSLGKMVCW